MSTKCTINMQQAYPSYDTMGLDETYQANYILVLLALFLSAPMSAHEGRPSWSTVLCPLAED
jgi:hypothetical protein